MSIMEVTLSYEYFGQECINRWNYLATGTPAAVSFSFALADAFGAIESAGSYPADTVLAEIADMVSIEVTFNELAVKDVYSITDFYSVPFVVPLIGAATGDTFTPALAAGFRTNRTRSDIRRGTKRFAGIVEGDWSGGGAALAGTISDHLVPIATVMSDNLEYDDEGNTLTFAPIIVGKERYVPDAAHPERVAYRYYEDEETQLEHIMESIIWSYYSTIRTQTSRQYGRGR